jgi:hypothetical protein
MLAYSIATQIASHLSATGKTKSTPRAASGKLARQGALALS